MSVTDEPVVLLAPEEESVPEHAVHEDYVDLVRAGLAARFAGRDDVAVHARLAWFPDRGDTRIRLDPDVFVAFGRPFAPRSSWRTWDEGGVVPTVVVEVWSEHDTDAQYRRRLERARRYGVAEVVVVAPFAPGGVRVEHLLPDPTDPTRWRTAAVSVDPDLPVRVDRLGITLAGGSELVVADEDGTRWPSTVEAFLGYRRATAGAERLAVRLRAAGLDPDED